MKQKDQLTIRMLRSLVFLMLMMLAPIGAWAEEYPITVGGVQVTDANASNVLDDQETPTVVFNATTNTLTLTNATINGDISTTLENLTINLVESNTLNGCITNGQEYTSLSFTGEGSLGITNDEGVFNQVDSYELASGLYLASYSPAPYCDDGSLRAADGNAVTSITISTNETYPVWVYTGDEHTGYTQLTADAPSVNGTSGTANYNGSTLTLTSFECTTTDGGPAFYIGQEVDDLIVNLIGTNAIMGNGNGFYFVSNDATLTFTTTGQTPGSFQLTDGQMATCNGEVVPSIACENGLVLNDRKVSADGIRINIADSPFTESGNLYEGKVSFDASTNTLTLNDGLTIGSATASSDIIVYVDHLTVELNGESRIYGNIQYVGANRSSSIQINKADEATSANLTLTNVSGFGSCTWGDGLYLSAHDGQGATIDVHYQHYEGEGGAMQSYYGTITDVTFSTTGTNAIWVAGTQVTSTNAGNIFAGDETNDGKVSYDFDTHTLTLDGARLSTTEAHPSPMVISQGALNVLLKGGSYIAYSGDNSNYLFQNTGSSGALTISASDSEASLGVTSEFYDGDYKGLCDGFSTVTFNNDLGLFNRSGSKAIENITGHAPSFYVDNGTSYWQTNKGLLLNATYYYKIDYVDDTIAGSGEEVSLATDETNWGFGGASFDISDLAGPCTITAYAKLNGDIIGSNKAKLFGSNPSPFRLVYGADPVDLVLAPAIEEDDGISINGIEANVSYNSETGKISSSTLGSFGGPVAMSASEGKTTILNNYFTMNFEVVPPAPTVSPESGTYLSTHDPITIIGTGLANTTVRYKWDNGDAQVYSAAINVKTGTLKAWEEHTESSTTVTSDTTAVVYTVNTDIATLYAAPIEDLYYTGSAVTPTIVVKETEGAEASLTAGTDYIVSYKQGETAIGAADLINVATYTAVISGQGSYGGTKEVTFNIIKATPTITFAQESYSATLGETFTSPATVDDWTVTPTASSNMSVATISEGQITLVGVGTTTITVTYAGDDNYNSTSASYQLVVSRALDIAFVGSNLWATYYATEDLTVPEGLKAYPVSSVNQTTGVVTVPEQELRYIPAEQAILLQREANGAANGYTATAYTTAYTDQTTVITSILQGTSQAASIEDILEGYVLGATVYVLYNDAFVKATSGEIPANRGFLVFGEPAMAPKLTIEIGDGATGINDVRSKMAEVGSDFYDLSGRKLSGKPSKSGLYIKNGKKVVVNK